ncbi:phospholipase D-like domain-containing protein [Saccharicrinis aurantiacus]|uniref:phospholipase D-like domain-containing protein n=1 Tax=Saccharicrinis aurantiacus TaxID=1849719 RepID=UPI0008380866|nr:phospholipase D-like domain-containing protein [Saccharicrinis aurantiacus]
MKNIIAIILFVCVAFTSCTNKTGSYQTQFIFNDAQTILEGKGDRVIFNSFMQLLNQTPVGADVYISIYMFDDVELAHAINNAKHRGVNVHIQVDQSRESSLECNQEVISILNKEFSDFTVLNNATKSSINHNKFALFSEISKDGHNYQNIVFQTSSNFMDESTYKFQDAQVFQSEILYGAYRDYFKKINAFSKSGSMLDFEYYTATDSALNLSVQFYPKRSKGKNHKGDCLIDIMDQIDLDNEGELLVNMSAWTGTRKSIFSKLKEIAASDIELTVITKSSNSKVVLEQLALVEQAGANVIILDYYGTPKQNTHMKVLTFKGAINNKPACFVVSGTHNITNNALRYNNETLLYFTDAKVYDIYNKFHTDLLNNYHNL